MQVNDKLISNNYTSGRFGRNIKRIVLHTYGGAGTSLYNWFNRPTTNASAHYAVMFDGTIERYVKDSDIAWHAGTSAVGGQANNNWESIGIEHQDNGNWQDAKRTDKMYESSAQLVADLCVKHKIPCKLLTKSDRYGSGISLHNYYATKACPGNLDANRIIKRANEIIKGVPQQSLEWKKGWNKKEEHFQPKKDFHLYDIVKNKLVNSYGPTNEKVVTMYQKGNWRMTEWSYNNNKPRAFKLDELTWKPVETKPAISWAVFISEYTNVDDALKHLSEANIYENNIETFVMANSRHEQAVAHAYKNAKELKKDFMVLTIEKQKSKDKTETKLVTESVVEYDEPLATKEYVLVYTSRAGNIQRKVFWDYVLAVGEYESILETLQKGDKLELVEDGTLINYYKEPMREEITHKKLGDHLRDTAEIAIPVQTISTFVGVIFAYYNPDMPMEVVLAFTGLFGVAFNVAYIVASKLLNKLD